MTIKELENLKIGDELYRPFSVDTSYHVKVVGKMGIDVDETWKNDYGTFCESRFVPNDELLLEEWQVLK